MHYRREEIKGSHNVSDHNIIFLFMEIVSLFIMRKHFLLCNANPEMFFTFFLPTEQQNKNETLVNQGVFNFLASIEQKQKRNITIVRALF